MSEENIVLSDAEKKDLQEAVTAEQMAHAQMALFQQIMDTIQTLPPMIFKLFGSSPTGQLAYSRSLSLQRLEECVHRLSDGMAWINHRQAAEEQAVQKAQKEGKIINFTGGKI